MVAIIGLIVAVSAPSLSAGIDSVRMAAATDSVASFLNAAVNRAERRQQPIEIEIVQKENRLDAVLERAGLHARTAPAGRDPHRRHIPAETPSA